MQRQKSPSKYPTVLLNLDQSFQLSSTYSNLYRYPGPPGPPGVYPGPPGLAGPRGVPGQTTHNAPFLFRAYLMHYMHNPALTHRLYPSIILPCFISPSLSLSFSLTRIQKHTHTHTCTHIHTGRRGRAARRGVRGRPGPPGLEPERYRRHLQDKTGAHDRWIPGHYTFPPPEWHPPTAQEKEAKARAKAAAAARGGLLLYLYKSTCVLVQKCKY